MARTVKNIPHNTLKHFTRRDQISSIAKFNSEISEFEGSRMKISHGNRIYNNTRYLKRGYYGIDGFDIGVLSTYQGKRYLQGYSDCDGNMTANYNYHHNRLMKISIM